MMLHDLLVQRGVRDATTIKVLTPMAHADPDLGRGVGGILAGSRSAGSSSGPRPSSQPRSPTHLATLRDGRTINYDLFLGVPIHRAPAVVEASGLAVDGWIPVDPATFATSFPNVYAVGDVTSAPVPRVGVIAEGEAGTVADVLIHRLKGGDDPAPYPGHRDVLHRVRRRGGRAVRCQLLGGPAPFGDFNEPSVELAAAKPEFGRRAAGAGSVSRRTENGVSVGASFRSTPNDLPWIEYNEALDADGRPQIRVKASTMDQPDIPPVQYVEYAPGTTDPMHSHRTDEFFIVTEGSSAGRCGERSRSIVFVPRNTEYAVRAGDEGARYFRVVV